MRLLLDEHISWKVAERLRERGIDAIAVGAERSLRGMPDRALFDAAQEMGRVVVTYDLADFDRLVREYAGARREHHGLVIVHPTRFPNSQLTRLADALARQARSLPPGGSFVVWLGEP